jgi:hypothetical protein
VIHPGEPPGHHDLFAGEDVETRDPGYLAIATSLTVAQVSDAGSISATRVSKASMAAEVRAASASTPLPWKTERVWLFGRVAKATGMPTRSRPVRKPTRVMPRSRKNGLIASKVSAGETRRS